MSKKIEELTPEQKELVKQYIREGIEIGLATGPDFDVDEVRDLSDKHRVLCGKEAAKEMLIFDSPMEACRQIKSLSPSNALYGQHDINWLQNYMFCRNVLGLKKETESIVYLYELAKRVHWFWMSSSHTIITRRPAELHMINKPNRTNNEFELPFIKVLHNTSGPAIRYVNGDAIYALNGLRVPEWLINEPYDINRVMKISNVEVRNEALKLGGPDVLEKHAQAKTLHEATIMPGGNYRLYSIEIGDRTRICLRGHCPSSGKQFNEYVPPHITTVEQALHWREWGNTTIPGVSGYLAPAART